MATNRVIGNNKSLPWRLPSELELFKKLTLDKVVIMGNGTFESIKRKPLRGRKNIILSRSSQLYHSADVIFVGNLSAAIKTAKLESQAINQSTIMILGGAEIYAQTLSMADILYMTIVNCEPNGDTWFPDFNMNDWVSVDLNSISRQSVNDEYSYTHYVLKRRR